MTDHAITEAIFSDELLQIIKKDKDGAEVLTILTSKSDIHRQVDYLGKTLLHYAAEYGNDNVVKYLVDSGADVDRQDYQGKTPIMLAATSTTLDVLFDCNADIYVKDKRGNCRCAVHRFLETNYNGKFYEKFSFQHPSDIELALKLADHDCSIYSAIKFRRAEVTRELLKRGCPLVPPNSSLCQGDALILAVDSTDLENVRALLDFGVDANAQGIDGYTPMSSHVICREADDKRLQILRLLLERGADPMKIIGPQPFAFDERILAYSGEMQMAGVLKFGTRATVRVLMGFDVDLNARDQYDKTAIHYAMVNEIHDIFEEFEGKEFDVNSREKKTGSTLLHCMGTTNFYALKFLHANGADLNAVDRNGITVLMKVWRNNEFQNGYPPYELFSRGEVEQCARVIDYLVYHGADSQVVLFMPGIPYSIFCDIASEFKKHLIEDVLVQLAIDEARGTLIRNIIGWQIERREYIRDRFDRIKKSLEKMKKITTWGSISLYELVVCSEAAMERYVRNIQFRLYLDKLKNRRIRQMDASYYAYFLRNRLTKAIAVARLRKKVTTDLLEALRICQLVAEKIMCYLDECDLKNLYFSLNYSSFEVKIM